MGLIGPISHIILTMIAIIDYGAGNIRSVTNALGRLGAEWRLTADPAEIIAADCAPRGPPRP